MFFRPPPRQRHHNINPNHVQQQLTRLPDPDQLGVLIVRGVSTFARRNPIISGSYVMGLIILLFFSSGITTLTQQQIKQYDRIMNTIDLQAEYDASYQYYAARDAYRATKGWFWSCDSLCQRNKKRMENAEHRLDMIRKDGEIRMSNAKKVVGIYSEIGVGEVKDKFWDYFHQGKAYAKRQSMWDAMFIGMRTMIRGRDESIIQFGIRMLIQVLINFSMGLLMSLIFFIFGVWSIIRSYQPNPIMATLFFIGAILAATSFVVTYLAGLYGAAATGIYAVAKVAETASRQAQLGDQQRRQRMGYNHQRPHYD